MSKSLSTAVTMLAILGGASGLTGQVAPPLSTDPERTIDPRSHELLMVRCSSLLAERELTLFGNGTLRLRKIQDEEKSLQLAELPPEVFAGYRRSLLEEGDTRRRVPRVPRRGPGGEWVEQCALTLHPDLSRPPRLFRFSRVDALSLELSRLVSIADALFREVELREVTDGFPVDYRPRVGDVVLRADGSEFEVRRFTADARGVELEGLQQPLVLYVSRDELAQEFVGLVRRRP